MNPWKTLAVAALAAGLAGCGAGRDIADIVNGNQSADLASIKGPPLVVPPDFTLRPPRGGGDRTRAAEASRQARNAVFGSAPAGGLATTTTPATAAGGPANAAGPTPGEAALLRRASAGEGADPNIRAKVNADTAVTQEDEKTFVDKLVKYKDNDEAQASGTGVSANPKPTIKRQGEIF